MDTDKKIKLFIQGMSRYFKKLPFVISFKINEDDVKVMFEQNSEKWIWGFNFDLSLYLGETDENWVGKLFDYTRNLCIHLGLENTGIPYMNTDYIVRSRDF